ncbi:type VI secretion system protein ImpH [Pseudoduganella flava]|uniref:Type VI secretion system baseplate subunit TssG n=1 Tax=Pseudoduganella flava TaxID=871742 RepID=A0A562PHQ3_9BURK|nr:type VI secretion system baseplate subunit TssG [Pseudoduganella flava]QGZ37666.1 type VI secretion system baseplate subunit TssG [Pseudoduganella flava]TWI43971.1 type VI secretion system protein ImpH [Pseudoduganella flava]
MHATKRRFEPAVIERLFAEPYRFQYFQAVRMLELWLRRRGVPEEGAIANYVRFQNSMSLAFPPSEIEALVAEPRNVAPTAATLAAALQSTELRYVRLTPAFMGFLGSSGALPAHYTERIAAHALYEKDDGPRAFLDAFSNRSLALFYEAWRKYRLELKYHGAGKDAFLPLLLSLAGTGHESLRRRLSDHGEGVLDESIAYFATAMAHRPASAVQIGRVLAEYFGQPIRVEQFVGCWYDVPDAQQTVLGMGNSVLGGGAMAGARVWQRDLRVRLVIGPLDLAAYESFLPGGRAARALASMVTMFTGVSLEYEVQLVLRAADVHGMTLDAQRTGGRLGWDSFVVAGAQDQDRADVRYAIHAV